VRRAARPSLPANQTTHRDRERHAISVRGRVFERPTNAADLMRDVRIG
jgi:hypothetical protein